MNPFVTYPDERASAPPPLERADTDPFANAPGGMCREGLVTTWNS
jgi:hypothetical protein